MLVIPTGPNPVCEMIELAKDVQEPLEEDEVVEDEVVEDEVVEELPEDEPLGAGIHFAILSSPVIWSWQIGSRLLVQWNSSLGAQSGIVPLQQKIPEVHLGITQFGVLESPVLGF